MKNNFFIKYLNILIAISGRRKSAVFLKKKPIEPPSRIFDYRAKNSTIFKRYCDILIKKFEYITEELNKEKNALQSNLIYSFHFNLNNIESLFFNYIALSSGFFFMKIAKERNLIKKYIKKKNRRKIANFNCISNSCKYRISLIKQNFIEEGGKKSNKGFFRFS